MPLTAVVITSHVVSAVLLTLLIAGQQGRLGATRLLPPRDQPAWKRTALLVIVLMTQPWIVALDDSGGVRTVTTLMAMAVAVVCLPAALATVLRGLSAWRATRNLETGRAGRFLGWRITNYRSRALARLTGSICALVVIVGHAGAILAGFSGEALEARRTTARIGTSALVASQGADEDVIAFAQGRGLGVVAVHRPLPAIGRGLPSAPPDEAVTLAGNCPDLQELGIPCRGGPLSSQRPSARLDEMLRWYTLGSGEASVAVLPAGSGVSAGALQQSGDVSTTVVVFSPDGADLDALRLSRDAYHDGLGVSFEAFGETYALGAFNLLHKSYWLFVFGVPGVLTLIIVSALTWAAVVIEESKALVRSPLLAEREDIFASVAAVRVALPIAAGGIAGAGATAWLLAAHAQMGALEMPTGFLISTSLASLVLATLSWWAARRLMVAASRQRWSA